MGASVVTRHPAQPSLEVRPGEMLQTFLRYMGRLRGALPSDSGLVGVLPVINGAAFHYQVFLLS